MTVYCRVYGNKFHGMRLKTLGFRISAPRGFTVAALRANFRVQEYFFGGAFRVLGKGFGSLHVAGPAVTLGLRALGCELHGVYIAWAFEQ